MRSLDPSKGGAVGGGRRCPNCGTVLAVDNTARLCSRCSREQRDQLRTPPPRLRDEFFETDEFKAAFRSQHIGKVFKAYRHHHQHLQQFGKALNQEQLGRWLGLTQAQVSKIENGKPEQNLETLSHYARILHLPQHLLWFDLPGQSRLDSPGATHTLDAPGLLVSPIDWEIQEETKRRTFLAQTAGAVASVLTMADESRTTADVLGLATTRVTLDLETLEGLEQTTLGLRRAYRSAGALSLLGPSHGTLNLLTEMLPGVGQHQDRLITAIGQTAGLIGIMLALDLDDFVSGGRYLSVAARAGQQVGNGELLAFTLGARAFHSAYSGDPAGGRDFADAALGIAKRGVSPVTHGWLSAVASEMYASDNNELACRRLLDDAAQHLESADPTQPWTGVGVFNSEKLAAYVGGNLMRLHRYRDAQQILHDALDKLDTSLVKHRCTAFVDLAEAYAADSKAHEACEYAANALAIVAHTRHAASLRRIEKLYVDMREHDDRTARPLGEKLIELKAAW